MNWRSIRATMIHRQTRKIYRAEKWSTRSPVAKNRQQNASSIQFYILFLPTFRQNSSNIWLLTFVVKHQTLEIDRPPGPCWPSWPNVLQRPALGKTAASNAGRWSSHVNQTENTRTLAQTGYPDAALIACIYICPHLWMWKVDHALAA